MTIAIRRQLQLMARYNVWATRRLLGAIDGLSDDEYRRDVGLFFKSIHGTLNHLIVAEHDVWFARIHDREFPQGIRLDAVVEDDRQRLKAALVTKAERWVPLVEGLDDDTLAHGDFEYRDLSGQLHSIPMFAILTHVFNHGTHHRGQITSALTMLHHESPALDLVYMIHEEAA